MSKPRLTAYILRGVLQYWHGLGGYRSYVRHLHEKDLVVLAANEEEAALMRTYLIDEGFED